ncbi:MAG TPA: segregation/condensation protein A [Spirochaetia bacterium]|nr:segregation/condensation protein A [Spirochaetia bacterium]
MEETKFHLGEFEGPLDLLLFLIKKQEINIYDIPIARITEQYLEYLAYAAKIELEGLTEFYLMAATLLYIKSRMLLPVEVDLSDELEDPRKELVEKLIEYQQYKKLSELIAEKEQEADWLLDRKTTQNVLPFTDEEIWEEIDVWDLLKTFSSMVSRLTPERIIDLYEEVTINEKLTYIRELLAEKKEILFADVLSKHPTLLNVICAFFALLEMVKSKEIAIYQNKLFGDIRIRVLDQVNGGEAGRETETHAPHPEDGPPIENELPTSPEKNT